MRCLWAGLCSALLGALTWTGVASARADEQPSIIKDSVQVTAFTINEFKKSYDTWSWVPLLRFSVNGPLASGSQLYADFTSGSAPRADQRTRQTKNLR
jgi:hypothetical protein